MVQCECILSVVPGLETASPDSISMCSNMKTSVMHDGRMGERVWPNRVHDSARGGERWSGQLWCYDGWATRGGGGGWGAVQKIWCNICLGYVYHSQCPWMC